MIILVPFRLAKEEMARQDMKRKLAAVDADVLEAYRRVCVCGCANVSVGHPLVHVIYIQCFSF